MVSWNCQSVFKVLFLTVLVICSIEGEVTDQNIVGVRIESCRGCQLNRLPEVKKFIFEDVPLYNDVVFKAIQGAPPELIYLNSKDEEIKRISLGGLSRSECNDLLTDKGFQKKIQDAPENHRTDF